MAPVMSGTVGSVEESGEQPDYDSEEYWASLTPEERYYRKDIYYPEEYESVAIDNPYRYAGYEYLEQIGIYDLNARYYNPEIARFLSPDPYYNLGNRVIGLYEINVPNAWSIIQANNIYVYCGNSPFLFIDPFGLADVIIYTTGVKKGDESDWTKQAVWMKNELENNDREVIMLSVSDRSSFETAWNGLGTDKNGNAYSIDNVYIYSHGTERALILQDGSSTEALSINGLNLNGDEIGNINNLHAKEMKTLYLYSCNAGHLDQYSDGTEEDRGIGNVASVFSTKVVNGVVKAYDGNVGFGISILSYFGIGGYKPRLSNDQTKFNEIRKYYGHYYREPRGMLTYYNGEYKPFGYFPNTQITAA